MRSSCLELITYTPYPRHSANPKQTLFHQHALLLSAFPTAMIARRIEKASLDRFGSNAGVGKQGFEWVLSGGQSRPSKRKPAKHDHIADAQRDNSRKHHTVVHAPHHAAANLRARSYALISSSSSS